MPTIYLRQFPNDTDETRAFYELIGRIIVLWGRLESTMVDIMWQSINHPMARFPKPKEMPVSLKRRLNLWKDIFRNEPLVGKHRDHAIQLAADVKRLSNQRHALIHASIGTFEGPETGAVATLLSHKGPDTFSERIRILTADLQGFIEKVISLYERLSPIAIEMLLMSVSKKSGG